MAMLPLFGADLTSQSVSGSRGSDNSRASAGLDQTWFAFLIVGEPRFHEGPCDKKLCPTTGYH